MLFELSRITPAHAGKRQKKTIWRRTSRDHPRACGEKHFFIACYTAQTGSPPRMRGKARCGKLADLYTRITPAHAGKRGGKRNPNPEWRDHPRACGEKFRPLWIETLAVGSPPRMRGKVIRTIPL